MSIVMGMLRKERDLVLHFLLHALLDVHLMMLMRRDPTLRALRPVQLRDLVVHHRALVMVRLMMVMRRGRWGGNFAALPVGLRGKLSDPALVGDGTRLSSGRRFVALRGGPRKVG